MQSKLNHKILIADRDPETVELLQSILEREQYQVRLAATPARVQSLLETWSPDLVFLHAGPGGKGLETGRMIKANPFLADTLLIYLADQADEELETDAYDNDADGFLVKPIRPRALLGRIRSLFNRRDQQLIETEKVVWGELTLDRGTSSVFYGSKPVPVAQKEFDILYLLARQPNKIFSREELIHYVWGRHVHVLARTVDVHIHKLREKIGEEYISTIKGLGYRLSRKL